MLFGDMDPEGIAICARPYSIKFLKNPAKGIKAQVTPQEIERAGLGAHGGRC